MLTSLSLRRETVRRPNMICRPTQETWMEPKAVAMTVQHQHHHQHQHQHQHQQHIQNLQGIDKEAYLRKVSPLNVKKNK